MEKTHTLSKHKNNNDIKTKEKKKEKQHDTKGKKTPSQTLPHRF